MNFNDKDNNEKIEFDELNIKSHLNDSLDLSGISVSEDLINRTLAAIKEQSLSNEDEATNTSITKSTKKIVSWNRYVRGFAGVAAAVVIVVVGYNLIQSIPIGMKKSNDTAKPEMAVTMDSAAGIASTERIAEEDDNQSFNTFEVNEKPDDVQYTITAEVGALEEPYEDNGSSDDLFEGALTKEVVPSTTDEDFNNDSQSIASTQELGAAAFDTGDRIIYNFRQIFIPTPEQAEYITISDNQSETSIKLTQPDDIEAFYFVMDSYQYSNSGNDSLIDPNYSVEMNSPELGTLYTILVGRNLTVSYIQGTDTVENTYYIVEDAEFKQDLAEFFEEHLE